MLNKMINQKGQSAIEFFIVVGAAVFFFVAFVFSLQLNIMDAERENLNTVLKENALNLQNEINLAFKSGDGYSREFNIPYDILSREYEINVTQGLIYTEIVNGRDSLAIPSLEVIGEPKKGKNLIKNVGGIVYLN